MKTPSKSHKLLTSLLTFSLVASMIPASVLAQITETSIVAANNEILVQVDQVTVPSQHINDLTALDSIDPNATTKIFMIEIVEGDGFVVHTTGEKDTDIALCMARDPKNTTEVCTTEAEDKWSSTKLGGVGYVRQEFTKAGVAVAKNNGAAFTVATGDKFRWVSETHPETGHGFYIAGYFPALPTGNQTATGEASQKIDTQIFNRSNAIQPKLVKYDPQGYVFDKKTLLPINGNTAKGPYVHVYEKGTAGTFGKLQNAAGQKNVGTADYQLTSDQGIFSFVVIDGTYALDVLKSPAAPSASFVYTAPAVGTLMQDSAGIRGLTGSDIKVNVGGTLVSLYKNVYPKTLASADPIVQTGGKIQRRDIPVDAVASGLEAVTFGHINALKTVNHGQKGIWLFGQTNLPYSKITVTATTTATGVVKNVNLGTDAYAGADGNYAFMLEPSVFNQNTQTAVFKVEQAGFYGDTTSTTASEKSLTLVQAAAGTNEFTIEPFPSYLDGIAKDASGKPLAGVEIKVVDEVRGETKVIAVTDSTGRFTVPGHLLPVFSYHLEYGAAQRMVKTSEFLADNKEFLATNKLDLFSEDQALAVTQTYIERLKTITPAPSGVMVPTATVAPLGVSGAPQVSVAPAVTGGVAPVTDGSTTVASSQLAMYIVLLILLLVVTGLLVVFYLKKKHEPHLYGDAAPVPAAGEPPAGTPPAAPPATPTPTA